MYQVIQNADTAVGLSCRTQCIDRVGRCECPVADFIEFNQVVVVARAGNSSCGKCQYAPGSRCAAPTQYRVTDYAAFGVIHKFDRVRVTVI